MRGNREKLLNDFGLERQVTKAQEFEWLEQRVLETVSHLTLKIMKYILKKELNFNYINEMTYLIHKYC